MGGMGGGMMGGMGGGMGGMGGGMRSVPPTDLPSALLEPRQTRHLPTRLVSITRRIAQAGVSLPEKGERLQIVGDVDAGERESAGSEGAQAIGGRESTDLAVATGHVASRWRVGLGYDRAAFAKWANDYELTLAKDFVEHLDGLPEGETGRLLLQVDGKDAASEAIASRSARPCKARWCWD